MADQQNSYDFIGAPAPDSSQNIKVLAIWTGPSLVARFFL
jgi:hypothetical protein